MGGKGGGGGLDSRKANAIFITKDYSDRPLCFTKWLPETREDLVDREMARLDLCPSRQGSEAGKRLLLAVMEAAKSLP